MTAREVRAMGQDDVRVTVVTPERAPLSLFCAEASAAVADELSAANVQLRTGAVARVVPGGLALEPSGERLVVERVVAVPRVLGPGIAGPPGRRGGLRPRGRRRARRRLRAHLGGRRRRLLSRQVRPPRRPSGALRRAEIARTPLWWRAGKVVGDYLPPWLVAHGAAPAPAEDAAPATRISVHRPLSRVRGTEARYLYDLARQFRTEDPEVATLGQRLRAARAA